MWNIAKKWYTPKDGTTVNIQSKITPQTKPKPKAVKCFSLFTIGTFYFATFFAYLFNYYAK